MWSYICRNGFSDVLRLDKDKEISVVVRIACGERKNDEKEVFQEESETVSERGTGGNKTGMR